MDVPYYATSIHHILAELERIDLLVRIQVQQVRQTQQNVDDFQGLYISEQEVDRLLQQPFGMPRWAAVPQLLSHAEVQNALETVAQEIARRKAESLRQGLTLRLESLAHLFDLSPFDLDVLLICLAPEFDLRYERLYAYLQDDVTKKRPGVDLVLNLLCPSFEEKLRARGDFTAESPLFRYQLLEMLEDPANRNPPLLSKSLKVDERVVNYLLGSDELDRRLLSCAQYNQPQLGLEDLLLSDDLRDRLRAVTQSVRKTDKQVIFYFQGPYGVGKQSTAEGLCRELGKGLLVIDGKQVPHTDLERFAATLRLIARESLLQNAGLYWKDFETLLADNKHAELELLIRELEDRQGLTFLAGEELWEPRDALYNTTFIRLEFPRPGYAERIELWTRSLTGRTHDRTEVDVSAVAGKFLLSGGQIRDAAATARNLARWRDPEKEQITVADLHDACRLQSTSKLTTLAQKILPNYTWDDIVLPPDRLEQLREICNYVKYRSLIYEEWGFDRKLSLGKGLNVLFAGPSGTGKTMSAEIIAGELGLELYKIDLSTIVSKYIGETEKNLSRIFSEAETSNAILFFDEADALFGKRSAVKDAHDRYANIEISYLLQKMEEYRGVVILATNLHENIDDAFVRRMHFTVDFPFPNEDDRRRIWERIWPQETPRNADLDLDAISRFELAGGNIRSIALAAAFLAADDGEVVRMSHLIRATKREFQKMGKVIVDDNFG